MGYTVSKNEFTISTDKSKVNIEYVHQFLSHSYWSSGMPIETVKKAMDESLCFRMYDGERQIGYARMITDQATFAYLADVFIDENFQGKGLGKWLIESILAHRGMQGLRRIMLATKDAHTLYEKCGFTPLNNPDRYMVYDPRKK